LIHINSYQFYCEPEINYEQGKEHFNVTWNKQGLSKDFIVDKISEMAYKQFKSLKKRVEKYKDTYTICLVTHTVPEKELLSNVYPTRKHEFWSRYIPCLYPSQQIKLKN
jgi:hypothetical protein